MEEEKKEEVAMDPRKEDSTLKQEIVEPKVDSEDLITQANAAAIRLENANKEMSILIDKQTALRVESTLGGQSEAGSKRLTKEEKEEQNARDFLSGSGMEDIAFPENKRKV